MRLIRMYTREAFICFKLFKFMPTMYDIKTYEGIDCSHPDWHTIKDNFTTYNHSIINVTFADLVDYEKCNSSSQICKIALYVIETSGYTQNSLSNTSFNDPAQFPWLEININADYNTTPQEYLIFQSCIYIYIYILVVGIVMFQVIGISILLFMAWEQRHKFIKQKTGKEIKNAMSENESLAEQKHSRERVMQKWKKNSTPKKIKRAFRNRDESLGHDSFYRLKSEDENWGFNEEGD